MQSVSARLDENGTVIGGEEFYPYGESSVTTFSRKRFRFTSKERDSYSGLYYYGARYYSCWTQTFLSVDPAHAKTYVYSPYVYGNCNPVVFNDPSGMTSNDTIKGEGPNNTLKEVIITATRPPKQSSTLAGEITPPPPPVSGGSDIAQQNGVENGEQKLLKGNLQNHAQKKPQAGPGNYATKVNSRTAGFTLRHPIAAASIGTPVKGSTNISTNAVRFSTRIGLHENAQHEASQVNAFRHTLWQAKITTDFGSGVAKEVGNAHEENPYAVSGSNLKTTFATLSKADETVDLLNNIIGRSIGEANPNANMQVLALKVLDYYKQNGLWSATAITNSKGEITGYQVSQQKLSDEQYATAKQIIDGLNSDGFTPSEQKQRDIEAQETAKIRREIMNGPKF